MADRVVVGGSAGGQVADGRVVGLMDRVDDPAVRAEMAAIIDGVGALLVDQGDVPSGPTVVGLIAGPGWRLDAEALATWPALQVVAASSTGVDHIDVEAVTSRGGWVTHVAGYCTEEVADHALALILTLVRRVGQADHLVRRGEWGPLPGDPGRIRGTRLGLVGFGRIGRALAAPARALGMEVRAFSPGGDDDRFGQDGVRRSPDLAGLLGWADVVSLHVPLTESTRHYIDAPSIAAMRPGSFLVNVSRGGLVDQRAVVEALRSGHLAGVALDVLEAEPPATDEPLLALDTAVITPHVAWQSPVARREVFTRAASSIAAVLAGGAPSGVVGRPIGPLRCATS
jgi:D-3-phosphoglycerate dehydrogenase